ncbi:hypothetical protein RAA17_02235 [Komagataeibacter rhaeticus]|nr:hypothetical protein [Komagataeibacter rhaeticus]
MPLFMVKPHLPSWRQAGRDNEVFGEAFSKSFEERSFFEKSGTQKLCRFYLLSDV